MELKKTVYPGWQGWFVKIVSLAFIGFQLYTSGFGLLPDMRQRAVHVMFAFILALALVSPRKGVKRTGIPVGDMVLILIAAAACINVYVNYLRFVFRPFESTPLDLFLGVAIILISLEITRRTIGLVFTVLAALAILYAVFGYLIPGYWGKASTPPVYLVQSLYQAVSGVWGYITGIVATVVAMFIIFGSFLFISGGGRTFIDMAIVLAGRVRGGPALVAVISSALFGTISGSAVANTAMTGNFTIPLMKRMGYKPEFAGAVEATASTGGMIMPPIMGVGAFIMAEFLSTAYVFVMIAAIIPAVLYFLSVGLAVRFRAMRENLAPVPAHEIPDWREALHWTKMIHLVFPVIALLALLLMGFTETRVAFYAWALGSVLYLGVSGSRWKEIKEKLVNLIGSFEDAAKTLISLTPLLVSANIVVSLINSTGLAVKINELILQTFGFSVLLALIVAAIATIVLGMGLPSVAAYVLAAAIVGSAVTKMNFLPIATHMFLFYFASFGVITPPVCAVAYVAAGIAQTDWLKVAFQAMRIAIVAFLIPFFFIGQPALLMQGPVNLIITTALTALVGTVFLASGMMGYFTGKLNLLTRAIFLAAGVLLLHPAQSTDWWGLIALGAAFLINITKILPALARIGKGSASKAKS